MENIDAQDDLRLVANRMQDTIADMLRLETALFEAENGKLAGRIGQQKRNFTGYMTTIREIADRLA